MTVVADDDPLLGSSGATKQENAAEAYERAAAEILNAFDGISKEIVDLSTLRDKMYFSIENALDSDPFITLKLLAAVCAGIVVAQGALWNRLAGAVSTPASDGAVDENSTEPLPLIGGQAYSDAMFVSAQMLVIGNFDFEIAGYDVTTVLLRILYCVMIFTGLIVFAIFVGFITQGVSSFMESLASGTSKVTIRNHTLILGWNEATIRVVAQCAILRSQQKQFKSGKVGSVATSDIVLLSNAYAKAEMEEKLRLALEIEPEVDQRDLVVGRNIVCRVGDPTDIHDLVRAGAATATSILVSMTEGDLIEEELSNGTVQNGATVRTLLALRSCLFAIGSQKNHGWDAQSFNPHLKIVVQLSQPSDFVQSACFPSPKGHEVVFLVEISKFLDSLMFSCLTQPGIAKVIMELLDTGGQAFRTEKAKFVRSRRKNAPRGLGGLTLQEAQDKLDNCVLIGFVDESTPQGDAQSIPSVGIAPDFRTVLKDDDLLVFVSDKPMPDFAFGDAIASRDVKMMPPWFTISRDEKHVLLLGWRASWNQDHKAFLACLQSVADDISDGSIICLVNCLEAKMFKGTLIGSGCGYQLAPACPHWEKSRTLNGKVTTFTDGRITIIHVCGDASNMRLMESVIKPIDFSAAVVLSGAEEYIPLVSLDTRVLVIMVQLRRLYEKYGRDPIHIVAENNLDYTARVAPAPLRSGRQALDFINTQAITSRTLVQALAHPKVMPSFQELFADTPGLPNFRLVPAKYVVELEKPLTFADVLSAIAKQNQQTSGRKVNVCIGYVTGHDDDMNDTVPSITISPPRSCVWTFKENDTLICIIRDLGEVMSANMAPSDVDSRSEIESGPVVVGRVFDQVEPDSSGTLVELDGSVLVGHVMVRAASHEDEGDDDGEVEGGKQKGKKIKKKGGKKAHAAKE